MKSLLKSIFILFILLSSVVIVHAQAPSSLDGVQIDSSPSIPAPGQRVTIQVESFSTDLNAASIVWIVNGKTYAQGTGITSIQTTAPALGKELNILAVIMTVEGREIKKVMSIVPSSVDLIWESEGYTPPFYKGKALFAYENTLRITAIPHLVPPGGTKIDPRTLVYKWIVNDKVIQEQSGYGKQTLSFQSEIPRELDVRVEVGTRDGGRKGTASMILTPGDPSISFYEENPLYGVLYNKAIVNRVNLKNQEITIRAIPYNFTVSRSAPLSFLWSINNLERPDLSTNQSITLRTKDDSEGSSAISLEIRNMRQILQGARNEASVFFNKKSSL